MKLPFQTKNMVW